MSTNIVFVYLGLQVKLNQFSSNNSHHTSGIHMGSHAGKWPDLMTSKPDSVSTLGYHWTDHTGRPLEPGFRIQEMFIQYNYISNLLTYRAHRLSWLGQLSGIFELMRLINVKFENGIMVYHGFRGKISAWSQENRNNLDNTSLASSSHKYTWMQVEPHWLMLAPSGVPVAIQC